MTPKTKIAFFETPSNPTLEIVDIKKVVEVAHSAGALVAVDNAFATPVLQRPFEFGADIVIHSSTKYIDGQGRALGGIILCKEDFLKDHLQLFLRNTGPCLSPFNAWLHLKSLETLDLRMRQHCRNANQIAQFLSEQKNVRRVLYPFREDPQNAAANHPQAALAKKQMSAGGGIVTFEVTGGEKEDIKMGKSPKPRELSNNLGDAKSL